MVILLVVAILIGIHVGVALALMSVIGIWLIKGNFGIALSILGTTSFRAIYDYIFAVIPLFVLMGVMASLSGAAEQLFNLSNLFLGRVRGGLAVATVLANAVFAAITGVSLASAAVFTKLSLPHMQRHGYDKRLAVGTVAGSSVLGMLIPPSALFIVYGILSEEGIGTLFIAGIVPGLVLTAIYSIGIWLWIKSRPNLVIGRGVVVATGCRETAKVTLGTWPILALVALVLGGIYAGIFTPTEAGAVGAAGATTLALVKRKLNKTTFWPSLLETGETTAGILFLIITAQMYSRMLALSGLPAAFSEALLGLNVPNMVVLIGFILLLLFLGMLLDSISILLLTMPLMVPVATSFGYDLIWFGVIAVVAIEVGMITPPVGLIVYAMKSMVGELMSLEEIFQACLPFVVMMLIAEVLLVAFPTLSLWLPSFMKYG